jgi:hypothetical protein
MDAFHRILGGQSLIRRELQIAGAFVLVWFAMDLVPVDRLAVGQVPLNGPTFFFSPESSFARSG